MDIEHELAGLIAALDTVAARVEGWHPLGTDPVRPPVSGSDPNAEEERSVRAAAASLARARALAIREELAAVRAHAQLMAEQARQVRTAARAERSARDPDVNGALRSAAAGLVGVEDGDQAMERIVAAVLGMVASAEWAGMCVEEPKKKGRPTTVSVHAASAPLVTRLEELQAHDNAGPCVDALTTATTVWVPDLRLEPRWPSFRRTADEGGVRSVLAVGLAMSSPGGVLNVYSSRPDAFDDDTRALIEIFADHAAIALAGARHVGGLGRALQTRDLIGQAKGILMRERRVSAQQAFTLLVDASQHANLRLTAVAQWIVDGVAETHPAPPAAKSPRRPAASNVR